MKLSSKDRRDAHTPIRRKVNVTKKSYTIGTTMNGGWITSIKEYTRMTTNNAVLDVLY